MTIGLGYSCRDGVVVCADRRHTVPGYFKFMQGKLAWSMRSTGTTLAMTYAAGDTHAAKALIQRLFSSQWPTEFSKVLPWLKDTFSIESKGIYTIVAYRISGEAPRLYHSDEEKVIQTEIAHIGMGDSSVLHYLEQVILSDKGTWDKSGKFTVALGAYMIKAANDFIPDCDGGPDIVLLSSSGLRVFDEKDIKYYSRFCKKFDRAVQKTWKQHLPSMP